MKLFDNLYELSDAISSLRNSRNIWRLPSIILFLFLTAQLFYLMLSKELTLIMARFREVFSINST